MTSNPAIFEKAIAGSHDYDADIRALALQGQDTAAIYEALSQRDVQSAADAFRPLYDRTDGKERSATCTCGNSLPTIPAAVSA
jgi:transaldolase